MRNPILFLLLLACFGACKKQEETNSNAIHTADSSLIQINYLKQIKTGLKDSLAQDDFAAIDFSRAFKSKDVRSDNYFLRIGIVARQISTDFLLLKTDRKGNILKGRIIHVNKKNKSKSHLKADDISFVSTSLNRRHSKHIDNKYKEKDNSHNMAASTLPDVVVTGYLHYNSDLYNWYLIDILMVNTITEMGFYTYLGSDPEFPPDGGHGPIIKDETINISYENILGPLIDISKYLKCFSTLSDQGATFKITIFTDLPVNDDPNRLFDFKTGACGHSFIQLAKSNAGNTMQQTIGFYPETDWKSIEANASVSSKIEDNAGHEFNASLTVTVDATHFQNAINDILYYGKAKYDIDNFNCTDFALNVFNTAAPILLSIPKYYIPGSMYGEESSTPQGLYNELSTLSKAGGYSGGEIQIPGVAGYTGASHGPCN